MLVVDSLIAADDYCLVWIKLGKLFEQFKKFLRTLLLAVDYYRSIGRNIDHYLANILLCFVRFGGGRHADIEFILAQSKVPGDNKKHQNDQQNVDHRRDQKPKNPGFRVFPKIHLISSDLIALKHPGPFGPANLVLRRDDIHNMGRCRFQI